MNSVIIPRSDSNLSSCKCQTLPPMPAPDCMSFAYKIGHLSGANIRHEARKPDPQLFKLIGHASLFDTARRYIQEHSIREAEDEGEATETEQTMTDQALDEDDFAVSYVEDVDQESSIIDLISPSASLSLEDLLLQQKEACDVLKTPQAFNSLKSNTSITWEEESDSSTESGDDVMDDDFWSDSTYDNDDHIDHQYLDDANLNFSSVPLAGLCGKDSTTLHDDSVIWSQQPRVLSLRQVEDLFAQTFG